MPTHHRGTRAETVALDAYIKLLRGTDALQSRLVPVLEEHGLTVSQFGVLEALDHLGPLCLGELARKILRSGGNLTLVARNLERDGFVRRIPDPTDRRVCRLELTTRGKSLVRKTFAAHLRNLVAQMSALTSAEQQELGRLMKKLGIQSASQ